MSWLWSRKPLAWRASWMSQMRLVSAGASYVDFPREVLQVDVDACNSDPSEVSKTAGRVQIAVLPSSQG